MADNNSSMPKFRWYYFLFSIPIYLLALLPMPVIYAFSSFLRFVFYRVFSYRKEVVFGNLRRSFPEKDEKWISETANAFYLNLFDVTLETLTMAVVGKRFYQRRIQVQNFHVVQDILAQRKSFILVCGHIANWEWAGQCLHQEGVQVDVLYHPLSSKFFEWFMYRIRNRFGVYPIAMQATVRELLKRKNLPSVVTFIADQTPSAESSHWMTFLNQDTPVFLGAEKMAKKLDYPVVYGEMTRLKRGYYEIDFKLICAEPNKTEAFEITEAHMRLLEQRIIKKPEEWLWSHRRWKHQRNH
jgi:KDO2-lipid IV(A) lauroyltransferase